MIHYTQNWRRLLTCLVFAFILIGCIPQIYHPQLSTLDKGMSYVQVTNQLKIPPLSTHQAKAGNRSFEFHKYNLNDGVRPELYFLSYENKKLTYWGYVSEFRRQPDQELSTAINDVLSDLAKPNGK
jgi:hypothetical protein